MSLLSFKHHEWFMTRCALFIHFSFSTMFNAYCVNYELWVIKWMCDASCIINLEFGVWITIVVIYMGLVNHHNCWGALLTLAKVHLLIFTMLRNNFKFKYFFGAQVLVENLVLPIFNSCNVLESNNTSEQNKVPHDPKLHSTSP
jgi:hypothetical protein